MGTVISLIFIAIFIVVFLLGYIAGFGNILTFISKGVLGTIVSVFICYNAFGFVLNIGFINEMLYNFVNYLQTNSNFLTKILLIIRIDMIAFAVALFFIIKMLIWLLARLLEDIIEADALVMRVINKTLGVILALALTFMAILLVFQVVYWIPGLSATVQGALSQTFLRLDVLYLNNPLNEIIMLILG